MKLSNIIYAALITAILPGCEKKEYLYRDISSRIWLGVPFPEKPGVIVADSSETTFLLKPATVETDTLYIYANVTGQTAPTDRPFKLEFLKDSSNVTESDFIIGETVIPANSFSARVPVIISKSVPGLDLKKTKARAVFRFVPNENFLNAQPGREMFRLMWFDFLAKPETWADIQFVVGEFSQAKYRFIIEVLGMTDFLKFRGNINQLLALQAVLRKALKDYNENPENAGRPEGWPYLDDNGSPLVF